MSGLGEADVDAEFPDRTLAHLGRHLLGASRVAEPLSGIVAVDAPFAVYQTDQEDVSRLFGVGKYLGRISCAGDTLLFEVNVVQLDTFSVSSLLADPLQAVSQTMPRPITDGD